MLNVTAMARLRICGSLFLLPLCCCANVRYGDRYTQYRAFGDSITEGAKLRDPATSAYPHLVARAENVTVIDYALGGDQACDIAARQIFQSSENPSLTTPFVSSVLIGTNDVGHNGVGPYERVFQECHLASIAWLAIPAEYKVLVGGAGVRTTGAGERDMFGLAKIWKTQSEGATISFSIDMSRSGVVYAWPLIDDASNGAYSYALDGNLLGQREMHRDPDIATHNGTSRSMGLIRIPRVPAGNHVVTFRQTTSGPDGLSIIGIGAVPAPTENLLPVVLVGTVPFQMRTGETAGCHSTDEPCLKYIKDIEADVKLLRSDGLKIRLFDTRKYMFATGAEMYDPLHPNELGHAELAKSVEAAWPGN